MLTIIKDNILNMDITPSINKGAVIDSKIIKCQNGTVPIQLSGMTAHMERQLMSPVHRITRLLLPFLTHIHFLITPSAVPPTLLLESAYLSQSPMSS